MARIDKAQLPAKLVYAVSGFTMMEIIVSMFIMSIGILGVVSLQISSLNMNRDALMSVQSNQLISDLSDRIDANYSATYGPVALGDAPANGLDCTKSNCTPAQMADYDISQWLCAINSTDAGGVEYTACNSDNLDIKGTFPQGKGSITLTGDEYRIYLEWVDNRTDTVRYTELHLWVD